MQRQQERAQWTPCVWRSPLYCTSASCSLTKFSPWRGISHWVSIIFFALLQHRNFQSEQKPIKLLNRWWLIENKRIVQRDFYYHLIDWCCFHRRGSIGNNVYSWKLKEGSELHVNGKKKLKTRTSLPLMCINFRNIWVWAIRSFWYHYFLLELKNMT